MIMPDHNLYELRAKLYTYTTATGRANVKEETMEKLWEKVIIEMRNIIYDYHQGGERW